MMMEETVTLYRPVGQKELDLIRQSGWRRFPPRLPEQPIFYPVVTEEYAIRIARDWNTKDGQSGNVGYVTRFAVMRSHLEKYPVQLAGGKELKEHWIPADELEAFNDHIAGEIEAIREYRPELPILGAKERIAQLGTIATGQPYPLLFVTVSGAHLYGFPSPDSDYDLRGVHVLPLPEIVGLNVGRETIEVSGDREDLELDLVTHDVRKFMGLMLRKNGYVLEQLYSPLVLHTTAEHQEMKELGTDCITRHHAYHYLGFAETQWKLFAKEHPPRVKPLLYVYRVLLTGIHLMKTGVIEANLVKLNEEYRLPYVPELIGRKLAGAEKSTLSDADMAFHEREYGRLRGMLEDAHEASSLAEGPSAKAGLHDLLVRVRMALRPTIGRDSSTLASDSTATRSILR